MSKFYIYVDESGQETMGREFVVSCVVVVSDREELIKILENLI